ncbi:ABC transporter permease [Kineosporia succinea]|uniref:Peptide/nickel transport system permease protein n=1 Tax=Kineosporia succinea TaxID=84632 RepID=A0ABT9PDX8_9ACTN|nr:ABC transporter permease [Kineosporia succinea]MDP9830370.1 peptide/nickel transport system permease protein [Kineosporia succinea]
MLTKHRAGYVARRLAMIPLGVLIVVTATFFLINAIPSDPVGARLGDLATPEQIAAERAALGLDQSLIHRFLDLLGGILTGGLGTSYYTGTDVSSELLGHVTSTLVLVVPGFLLAAVLGVGLGVLATREHLSRWIRLVVTVLQGLPVFVLAVLGILLLVVVLPVLPSPTGQLDANIPAPPVRTGAVMVDALIAGRPDALGNAVGHLVLPVLSIGLIASVPFARITASALRSALAAEFSAFGDGNGLSRRTVMRNALRTSRPGIATVGGIVAAELIGGSMLIEQVFSWNGIGQWGLNAITQNDLPVVQAFVLFAAVGTMVIYLLADIVAVLLDPRTAS